MKKHILLILLPFLLLSIKSKGQAIIGISPYSVFIGNDTLPGGASDTISFWIVNSGTATFNDSMRIYTNVQDSVSAFTFYPIDTVYVPSDTIAPGDSIQTFLYPTYDIGPFRFHYDINVIVIWPAAFTVNTTDSLIYNEFLTIPDGVDEIDLSKLIKAYPNPVVNNLTLENTDKKVIEEVRIYDSEGRLIQTEKDTSLICTDRWRKGTYMIKIQFGNKKTQTIRVIKQ